MENSKKCEEDEDRLAMVVLGTSSPIRSSPTSTNTSTTVSTTQLSIEGAIEAAATRER